MKTAFCPGPGMGLYEFYRMPFGITGGPSSFQRLMDKVLHGLLPFVTSYIDDVLVHSPIMKCHSQHLQQVFERLANAGLTEGIQVPVRTGQSALPGTCIFRVRNVSGQRENSCDQGLADSQDCY